MFDEEKKQVAHFISSVFSGEKRPISPEDVYSYTFSLVYKNQEEELKAVIFGQFLSSLTTVQRNLGQRPTMEEVESIINRVLKSVRVLEQVFRPLSLNDPNYDVAKILLRAFGDNLLKKIKISNQEANIVSVMAHKAALMEPEKAKNIILMIKSIYDETSSWQEFLKEYYDAMDAMLTEFTYSALSSKDIGSNCLDYIFAAKRMIERQKIAWEVLSEHNKNEMLELARYDLFESVIGLILDQKTNLALFCQTFFDDFNNSQTFFELVGECFTSSESRGKISQCMFEHYSREIKKALATPAKTYKNYNNARTICNTLCEYFEKIDVLSKKNLISSHYFNDQFEKFQKDCLSKDSGYNIEYCAALVIDRIAKQAYDSKSEEDKENKLSKVDKYARLINFSINKTEYIIIHNAMMRVRICHFGSKNIGVEENIIDRIEPFFPPNIVTLFTSTKEKLTQSTKVNGKWERENPTSKMNVLLIEDKDKLTLSTDSSLKLPKEMTDMMDNYSKFYRKEEPFKDLEFSYDDNSVVLNMKINGRKYNVHTSLQDAVVLIAMGKKLSRQVGEISSETGLSTKEIGAFLKKTTNDKLKLFTISKKEINSTTVISWNKDFNFKENNILMIPQSKQVSHIEKEVTLRKLKEYKKIIKEIMAENTSLPNSVLQNYLASGLSASYEYDEESYNKAIEELCSKDRAIRIDEDDLITYCK